MRWLTRTGSVLSAPQATFDLILRRGRGGIGDVLLLMLLVLPATAPAQTAAVLWSADRGLGLVLTRLLGMYIHFSLTPMLVCVALALVLVGAARLRGRRLAVDAVMTACAYLWIPVGMLGLLGAVLAGLGLDLSFLPHVPLPLFMRSDPPWWLAAVRLVVAYGWSGWLAWKLFGMLRQDPPDARPAPRDEAIRLPRTGGRLLAGWLAACYLAGGIQVALHAERIRPLGEGDPAPAISLPRADGTGQVGLEKAGGPVVIEFWATWCPKCIEGMPALAAWARAHPEVAVWTVHQGGTIEEVRVFLAEHDWRGLVHLVDVTGRASAAWRIDTLPTVVVVTPGGSIAGVHLGTPPPAWLDRRTAGGS